MKTPTILSFCCVAAFFGAPLTHSQSLPISPTEQVGSPSQKGSLPTLDKPVVVVSGDATHKVEPKYPRKARENKIQGTVVLHGTIAKDGSVRSLSTISGDPLLAEATIDAARKWRYEPYAPNQVPAETQTTVTVTFSIDDAGVAAVSPVDAVRTAQSEDSIPTPSAPRIEVYDGPVLRMGNGVSAPRAILSPAPSFTQTTKGIKFEGTSILQLVVGPDGQPYNIKVVRALGKDLDERAVEAVSQWKFAPATKNGKPVAVFINVEVQFHLY